MTIFSANTGSFERVTVNNTTNATSYLDGAVTVAGGMSIQKDLRISGSMTINGLLTVVSMSSQYVTSSQYNVGVSKITVNDDDNVRFAGFSVFDSGSSSPTTASIYWDSLNHKFLYENLSGSSYNSAILIAGPKNTGSLGNETGLTSGYIPYATGDDHIDNSVMFQSSSNIGIGTSTPGYKLDVYTVGGSSATTRLYGNDQTNVRLRLENIGSGGRTWELIGGLPGANNSNLSIYDVTGTSTRLTIDSSGNIGVSTTNPISKFTVVENGFGIRMQQSGSGDYLLISNNQVQSYVAAGTANILYLNYSSGGNIVTGTGNVGIGTTNPASVLHLQSGTVNREMLVLRNTNTTSGASVPIFLSSDSGGSTTNVSIENGSAGDMVFRTGATSVAGYGNARMIILSGGNVGIGTTNPGYKLVVNSGINGTTAGIVGTTYGIRFDNSGSFSTNCSTIHGVDSTLIGSYQPLRLNASILLFGISNTEMMRIDSSGNVGIGTTNPGAKLHVYDNTTGATVLIRGINGNVASSVQLNHGGGGGRTEVDGSWYMSFGAAQTDFGLTPNLGGGLIFWYDGSTGTTNPMTLKRNGNAVFTGNIGIGTSSPASKLHIVNNTGFTIPTQGNIGGSVSARINFTGNEPGLMLNSDINATTAAQSGTGTVSLGLQIGYYGSNDVRSQIFWAGGVPLTFTYASTPSGTVTERMRIDSSGNVGIGTTNPGSFKLYVNGTSYFIGVLRTDTDSYLLGSGYGIYGNNDAANYSIRGSAGGGGALVYTWYGGHIFSTLGSRLFQLGSDGSVHANYDGTNERGYFYVGKDWSATNHRINRQVTQGGVVFVVSAYGASGVAADTAVFSSVNNGGANGANCALSIGHNSSTTRSINAGGTINASGADYAEYMTKNGDFTLHKGDICGVDVNGELTNKYSEAHSFVVKSTDPSYVGGDTWGNDNAIGEKPYLTTQGSEESDEAYAERVAQYEIDMEIYNIKLEDARKLVDRIAFSGQVPVNVVGASVGDYILPTEGIDDTIVGIAVTSPTFEQYQMAVGKVWKILEDGRAFISVKIG